MTLDPLGELLVGLQALPLERCPPVVEETLRPAFALVVSQLTEGLLEQGGSIEPRIGRQQGPHRLAFVGTPTMIADQREEWLLSDAYDGFNIMFPYRPGGLDNFVNLLVPELQRRAIFRRAYEGTTLRENLGLPCPQNRFFPR